MNRLNDSFEVYYQNFITQMIVYLEEMFDTDSIDESWVEYMLNYLMYVYDYSYNEEAANILIDTNILYDENTLERIISTKPIRSYKEIELPRIEEILTNNLKNFLSSSLEAKKLISSDIDREYLKNGFIDVCMASLIRLANSEIHMAQEKASVDAGNSVQEIASSELKEMTENPTAKVVIYKTWNATMDDRTCETCSAMNGTRVRVDDIFIDKTTGEYSGLGYTGGKVTYAHPNCRCWVTYDSEEIIIKP